MLEEAGYKGMMMNTYYGVVKIVASWLSEPDGNGGRLVDVRISRGDGTGNTFANLETKALEELLIVEGN